MGAELVGVVAPTPPQPWRRPQKGDAAQRDPFKQVPLRYLGYANEVGEAFRHVVAVRWVYFSYVVASGYVAAHAVQQGLRSSKLQHQENNLGDVQRSLSRPEVTNIGPAGAMVDTVLWQGLASVVVPGITINRVCAVSRHLLRRKKLGSPAVQRWMVTAIGLGCIPFIIHPIDRLVDRFMDSLARPFLKKIIP